MKKSDTVTEFMLIKAFSENGRNNHEVAIIPLTGDWLKKFFETTELLEMLDLDSNLGYVLRKDQGASFLMCRSHKVPFYEQWFGENDMTFLDARIDEIEQLCKHFECIKSENLVVCPNGLANYETQMEIKLITVDFDIRLIQEIVTSKN